MTRFDAVVFDLDGTLARRTQDIDAVFAAAFERAGVAPFGEPADLWAALDGPPDPDDRVGYLGAGFARLAAQRGREVDPLALAEAFVDGVDNTQMELTAGADAAIDAAAANGRTALLTNGPSDRQRAKVRALGLDDRLDHVVYAGDLPRRKPHALPFERTLDALDVAPERALYVGDSLAYDVAGAHTAGLAVAWLAPDGADPDPYDPEFVLESIADLPGILR